MKTQKIGRNGAKPEHRSDKVFTRKDYLEGRCDHHEYYMDIAREAGLDYRTSSEIARWRRALETDPHMNNIPLSYWDAIAVALGRDSVIRRALEARGDSFSLGTGVCLAKAAAREAVRQAILNNAADARDGRRAGRFEHD